MASNPTSPLSSTVRAWRTRSLLSIERQLLDHHDGLVAGQKLAQATDSMLRGVGKRLALPTRDLAIVAVGGYGDGLLAPHSDLDLLLITRSNPEAAFADSTPSAQLLYALWDAGLKLGYSIHSPASLLEACSNLDTRTSMLSARHIWGDRTLLESIDTTPPNLPRFVRDKFDERDARHLRYGDSRYVLQPDVKEGKGALRDLHTVSWLMRACEGHNDLDRLKADGVITNAEVALFRRAQRFLMAVRAHCHLISKRQENVLRFDLQPEIASRMNYRTKQGKNTEAARLHATERFMRNYYWSVKEVGNLTRTVCTLLEARHKKSTVAISLQSHVVVEGFPIANGRIDFPDSEITPQRIMQLFRVAHRRQCKFTPECLRTVRRYAPRFVAARHEPSIVQDLMAILCPVPRIQFWQKRGLRSPHRQRVVDSPEHYLRVMSESGVLGRMLPDFGRIIASMQYDNYHVYTNDEHTIRAIGI
nr:hypothetical protein [Actinomycetes bacterium]